MQNPALSRLRTIGLAEGVSLLVLLGIAMPLKYLGDMPLAVTVAGWIHGLLFMALCAAVLRVKRTLGWELRTAGRVVLAGLLPFGPFVIDSWLRTKDIADDRSPRK